MVTSEKPYVVALEEHYWDPGIAEMLTERGNSRGHIAEKLADLGDLRIKHMDNDGIDFQVVSHIPWTREPLNAEKAIDLAIKANDRTSAAMRQNSNRLAAFATLPMPDPEAAADELDRAVTKLGMVGAMVFPLTGDTFIDHHKFWPIFAKAQELDVPLYLHPNSPHDAVFQTYYKDYADKFYNFSSAGWGFAVETATVSIRMMLAGVFQEYPRLKMIIGHMGEGIPFQLHRLDEATSRRGAATGLKDTFCNNFWITTSGNFSTPALLCSMMVMGVDRILFSVDWPMVDNEPGMKWMSEVPICAGDKEKILSGNAKRLLKL